MLDERVLILTPVGADAQIAAELLAEAGIFAAPCSSLTQMCEFIIEGAGALVIAEEAFNPANLEQLTDLLRRQPAWSDIPLILLTMAGEDGRMSRELTEKLSGIAGITLLERPLKRTTLISAVQASIRARRRQYQVRQLLADQRHDSIRLANQANILETLNSIGRSLAGELDLHKLMQAVVDAATRLSQAESGAFLYNITDYNGESYLLHTVSGLPKENFAHFLMPRNAAIFAPTFRGERTVRSDDITHDLTYGANAPDETSEHSPVRSFLAVPVVARSGEVLGGLFFGHTKPAQFSTEHERLVEGIAAQAAIGIDNARLYDARNRLLDSERAARVEAERASRLKDEFLATVSHELRTPLGAILGWSHILRQKFGHEKELDTALTIIDRNTRVQIGLIEDLLDMSRIISGKLRLDVQRLDPLQFVEAAIASVQPSADARGVRLQPVLDTAAGPVRGDPNRLQQVVWNLLSNAIKFTPKGGRVQVSLQRVNSHVEISVSDTGKGIKREFLPHVFDRFRQADGSTTRSFGGLGLGLAIVKHLTELHGGTVRASSAGDNLGSTFTVELPLLVIDSIEPSPDTKHSPRESMDFPSLDKVAVLVVDDEPDGLLLIKRVLEDCGAEVQTAYSGQEALKMLENQRFDVLLSDIGMPEYDGYALIRDVRQRNAENGGNIPAAALTAFARGEDRTRALRAGYQMHISKPVEPSELAAAVATLVAMNHV